MLQTRIPLGAAVRKKTFAGSAYTAPSWIPLAIGEIAHTFCQLDSMDAEPRRAGKAHVHFTDSNRVRHICYSAEMPTASYPFLSSWESPARISLCVAQLIKSGNAGERPVLRMRDDVPHAIPCVGLRRLAEGLRLPHGVTTGAHIKGTDKALNTTEDKLGVFDERRTVQKRTLDSNWDRQKGTEAAQVLGLQDCDSHRPELVRSVYGPHGCGETTNERTLWLGLTAKGFGVL